MELQIEELATRRSAAAQRQASAEKVAREREKESLELSRTRVLHDIEVAANPRYREMLQASLAFLEAKIEKLS